MRLHDYNSFQIILIFPILNEENYSKLSEMPFLLKQVTSWE